MQCKAAYRALMVAGMGLGAVLFVASLIGVFVSSDQRQRVGADRGDPLSVSEFYQQTDAAFRLLGKTPDFLQLAVENYDRATIFKAPIEFPVSFFDNWILWSGQYLEGRLNEAGLIQVKKFFSHYQSLRYERGIERGIGHCSAHALAFADLLDRRYGVATDILGLEGHVVVAARLDQREIVLDPSLGLDLNASLRELEAQPQIAQAFYATTNYPQLFQTYDVAGNRRFAGASGYNPKMSVLERASDWLKFLLPVGLMLLCRLGLRVQGGSGKKPGAGAPGAEDARA